MAKGFWKRTFGSGGKKEEYYEELGEGEENQYYTEESELDYEEPSFSSRRSKVINMPDQSARGSYYPQTDGSQMQMIIFKPSSYDETQGVIDSLRAKKPVIVNLDELEVGVAQRILDFISGAVYALSGDIRKAARNILVVAPSNVEVSSNLDRGSQYDDYTEEEF